MDFHPINQHQCGACALKHLSSALVIAQEILNGYDTREYHLFLMGNLNEAQEQLTTLDNAMAERIRSLRLRIFPLGLQLKFDAEERKWLSGLAQAVAFRLEHGIYDGAPDETGRRALLLAEKKRRKGSLSPTRRMSLLPAEAASPKPKKSCSCRKRNHGCDIVIPLSNESPFENMELRLALRSIAIMGRNVGTVYLVGTALPNWLQNVRILEMEDRHLKNKDANLIDKLLAAAQVPELSTQFLFWSDDQFALREFDSTALRPVYNERTPNDFADDSRWHRRMRHTYTELKRLGHELEYNWDSHVPQPMNKTILPKVFGQVDYQTPPGVCVNTWYFGMGQASPEVAQRNVKITCESEEAVALLSQKSSVNFDFCGYNDLAFRHGVREFALGLFPERSRYERGK